LEFPTKVKKSNIFSHMIYFYNIKIDKWSYLPLTSFAYLKLEKLDYFQSHYLFFLC